MDERTQEWLHRTRRVDRKPAIRGGPEPDPGLIRQTSITVVAALAIMAVLIIAPLRMSDLPVPSPRLPADGENRVVVESVASAAQFVPVVGEVLPSAILPSPPGPAGIPMVVPHVPIWTSPRAFDVPDRVVPSLLPPAAPGERASPNLVTR